MKRYQISLTPIVGFYDKTSFMSYPSRLRIFGGDFIEHRLSSRRERFYALGCMLLNGNDVVLFSGSAKKTALIMDVKARK